MTRIGSGIAHGTLLLARTSIARRVSRVARRPAARRNFGANLRIILTFSPLFALDAPARVMDPARPAAALYPPDPGAIVKRWSAAKTAILPRWLLAHPGSTAALHPAQLAERWVPS